LLLQKERISFFEKNNIQKIFTFFKNKQTKQVGFSIIIYKNTTKSDIMPTKHSLQINFFLFLCVLKLSKMSKNQNPELETINASTSLESTQRLEAIKNLIFGENIQQIDQDFSSLKSLIDKRKEELENYIEETRKELHHTIDNLATDVNIRITELENKLDQKAQDLDHKKADRNVLGSLLVNLGEKIMKDY
jgi:hypothetical protein